MAGIPGQQAGFYSFLHRHLKHFIRNFHGTTPINPGSAGSVGVVCRSFMTPV